MNRCPLHARKWLRPDAQPAHGFTLVEVLVALSVMALLSLVGLRAFDAMSTSQRHTQTHGEQLHRLQSGLTQWRLDLDAATDNGVVPAFAFDGRVLRLTRRDPAQTDTSSPGLRVVAWAVHQGQWQRWQSAALRQPEAIRLTWERAANPDAAVSAGGLNLAEASAWTLYFFRGNAWTNPQSDPGNGASALPEGVRLQLALSPGQALAGDVQVDWASPALARANTP